MDVDLRNFLRNFSDFKKKALKGQLLRIISRDGVFTFQSESTNSRSILGACKHLGKAPHNKIGPVEDSDAWEENK